MYKLCYYRFGEVASHGVRGSGYDRARGYEGTALPSINHRFNQMKPIAFAVGNKMVDLTYLEEAFTSEHWIVRIYRVCLYFPITSHFNNDNLLPGENGGGAD